jgi:CBS domain containing-hemolysin-like protein
MFNSWWSINPVSGYDRFSGPLEWLLMLEWLLFRAVAIAVLILANGFFVAAEFAMVSIRETQVDQLLTLHRSGARTVRRLQDHLDEFLPAVQLGVTLCSLGLGWIGEPAIAPVLETVFGKLPHASLYAHLTSATLAFVAITYLHVLLGELVPKSLALRKVEEMALAVAAPMDFFIRITRPAVNIMNRSATGVLYLFNAPLVREGTAHSPEEIKLIATTTRRMGLLPEFQEQLIHHAVEANELSTREIMVPRQRIFSLPADTLIEDASARIVEEQHSRVPVYDPALGPEHIVGVAYSKDLSRLMHFRIASRTPATQSSFGDLRLGQIMRDVLFVPETKPVLDLLQEFKSRRRHLAIVVDEYGSTVGLVTVEDALEQLVGEMEDEFDVETQLTPRLALMSSDGAFIFDGSIHLRDLETQMQWDLPRDGGVETLAGFVLTRLGKIPTVGESLDYAEQRFTVVEMAGHRISRIRVSPIVAAPSRKVSVPAAKQGQPVSQPSGARP